MTGEPNLAEQFDQYYSKYLEFCERLQALIPNSYVRRLKLLPPTHPGELLREEIMPAARLTRDRLASLLGVSRRTINEIVTEKRSVSPDMAHRLARLFDTTAEFWLGLQQDVDFYKAARASAVDYKKIRPLKGAA